MRANSAVLVAVGLLAVGGWVFVSNQSGPGRGVRDPEFGRERPENRDAASIDAGGARLEDPVRTALEPHVPDVDEAHATPENPGGAPPSEPSDIDPHTVQFWHECMNEPDADSARDCIQSWLGGRDLPPEELASMVCGEVAPDGADRFLIEEVAALWPPEEMIGRIKRFRGLCNDPGFVWVGLLERQSERDPAWLEAFVTSLRPEDVFDGEGLALLFMVDSLREFGHEELSELLASGARGEWGGSDAQVAFALHKSFDLEKDPERRLALLESVVGAATFEGRPSEVEALVECVLQGSPSETTARKHLLLLNRLFEDPLFAQGTARRINDLYQGNRLPGWLSESDRRALVQKARDTLGS